jgi:hypothetical protein
MERNAGRAVSAFVLAIGSLAAVTAPASAAATHVSGVGFYTENETICASEPPTGYEDFVSYLPLAMSGSLEGCLYTKIVTSRDLGSPSGFYFETGEEVFVGSVDGGAEGTFATTYRFESKWDPDVSTGVEVRGRCQHPLVAGSATGGFEGAKGRLNFKDEVETGLYFYRGYIRL